MMTTTERLIADAPRRVAAWLDAADRRAMFQRAEARGRAPDGPWERAYREGLGDDAPSGPATAHEVALYAQGARDRLHLRAARNDGLARAFAGARRF